MPFGLPVLLHKHLYATLDAFENNKKSPTSSRDAEEGISTACGCSQDVNLSREFACNGLH